MTIGHLNMIVGIVCILAIFFTGKNSDFIGQMGGNSTHFSFIVGCVCAAFLAGSIAAHYIQKYKLGSLKKNFENCENAEQTRVHIKSSAWNDTKKIYVFLFSLVLCVTFVILFFSGGNHAFRIPGAGDAGNFGGMKWGFLALAGIGLFGMVSVPLIKMHEIRQANKKMTAVKTKAEEAEQSVDDNESDDSRTVYEPLGLENRRRVLERLLQTTM